MKKVTLCLFMMAAFMFGLQPQAQAAAGKAQVGETQKAGAQVKTKYFELIIPDGWFMPQPVKQRANDGISAVFAPETGKMAMTINVMSAPISAKDIATQTAAQMGKSGLKTTQPVGKNGFWVIDIEGKAKGQAWFGSDGKHCSVITMFGEDIAPANEVLAVLKSSDSSLFPKSIN